VVVVVVVIIIKISDVVIIIITTTILKYVRQTYVPYHPASKWSNGNEPNTHLRIQILFLISVMCNSNYTKNYNTDIKILSPLSPKVGEGKQLKTSVLDHVRPASGTTVTTPSAAPSCQRPAEENANETQSILRHGPYITCVRVAGVGFPVSSFLILSTTLYVHTSQRATSRPSTLLCRLQAVMKKETGYENDTQINADLPVGIAANCSTYCAAAWHSSDASGCNSGGSRFDSRAGEVYPEISVCFLNPRRKLSGY
jgi:hypothetical protein